MTRMVKVREEHLRQILQILWECNPRNPQVFCEVSHAYGVAMAMAIDAGIPTPDEATQEATHVC